MENKRFMDVGEVSQYLGISKWMVYKYVNHREIPFIPFGRLVRFDRLAVDRWAEKRTVRGFIRTRKETVLRGPEFQWMSSTPVETDMGSVPEGA